MLGIPLTVESSTELPRLTLLLLLLAGFRSSKCSLFEAAPGSHWARATGACAVPLGGEEEIAVSSTWMAYPVGVNRLSAESCLLDLRLTAPESEWHQALPAISIEALRKHHTVLY